MYKVAFLDVDGVFNTGRSVVAHGSAGAGFGWNNLDPTAIALLASLQYKTGCKFVLSSSWRSRVNPQRFGAFLGLDIIDATPYDATVSSTRGDDIAAWLAVHTEVTSYIIIDDESDMHDDQQDRLVQTNHDEGFGYKDYLKAFALFDYVDDTQDRLYIPTTTAYIEQLVDKASEYAQTIADGDDPESKCTRSLAFNSFMAGAGVVSQYRASLPDHKIRTVVNKVRGIAKEYGNHESLRVRLSEVLVPILQGDHALEKKLRPYAPLKEND